ncbi:vacuolar protein sorting-associated protein 4 [Mitosporidium daphniae]|uniref:Vacuolar protein sorting-associated protein 4 n=1 Tax=Mitosporidium daphniae TaxID=1485682 RepID=A0A098VMS5_9MICR|nr:vacuolar protein sorting-associated protein 4 [Mitosporidium daphniae]KGG50338.1 vacuolar protein sorting-associated protein 4 [Mitosporidium daphniae]|eukprot:XP_013236765.1 vacuolar protein sorting-associated protein 4 [Mitosporidium daphniae]
MSFFRSNSVSLTNSSDASDKLKSNLQSAILKENPNVKWEDVIGLESAKEALKEAVILPIKFPQLFSGKRKPWRGILLLVKSLFEMARESRPSIIFIDEIDSLCGSRTDGESEASRRVKTEFLVQMQGRLSRCDYYGVGVGTDDKGILVLGATNTPWQLDPAIRRRFEKRIYIPLPHPLARYKMFVEGIGEEAALSHQDLKQLAVLSEGFSGSDINVLIRDALMQPIRKIQMATHFKPFNADSSSSPLKSSAKDMMTPCLAGEPGAIEMNWTLLNSGQLMEPQLVMDDFLKSLGRVKASVSFADIEKHLEFTKEFGEDG